MVMPCAGLGRWVVLLACALAAHGAQPPASASPANAGAAIEAARVQRAALLVAQLHGTDRAAAAWAAYELGREQDREGVDALTAVAATACPRDAQESAEARERRAVIHAAVDALIRLGRPVPVAVVQAAIASGDTCEALILAARDPVAHRDPLLQLAQSGQDDIWLAACELLVDQHEARLASRLWSDLTLRLRISVTDGHRGGGSVTWTRSSYDGHVTPIPGFPPPVFYRLTVGTPRRDAVVLTDGYALVTWVREESPSGGFGGSRNVVDRDEARLDLLVHSLRRWISVPLAQTTAVTVALPQGTTSSYLAQVQDAYDQVLAGRNALAKALTDDRLITASLVPPRILVEVQDRRQAPRVPLPALPPTMARVGTTAAGGATAASGSTRAPTP